MKVIVCIKQIPDPRDTVFDLQKGEVTFSKRIINPADFHALEEGLRIKEQYGAELIAVSFGPERCDAVLTKALAYGADRAVRVWNDACDTTDAWTASVLIHEVVKKIGFDLILCGNASEDTFGELTWAALSNQLDVPVVTRVVHLELPEENRGLAHKKLSKGRRETYSFKLPAVIGVAEGINRPRYSALYSKTYREGIRKSIELMDTHISPSALKPLVSMSHVSQPKPRTKAGKKVSGLSMTAMMKVLKGETGTKKQIYSGPPAKGAEKLAKDLTEWIQQL